MSRCVLVTGGARSGKSAFAESIYQGEPDVIYIATAQVYDEEMKARVHLHQASRPNSWQTAETWHNLSALIGESQNYLLDCLTILTSNIMAEMTMEYDKISSQLQKQVEAKICDEIGALIEAVSRTDKNLVIVTNEVGSSVVPENHVARVWRDIVGRVNQNTARLCDEVYLVACGLPVKLK